MVNAREQKLLKLLIEAHIEHGQPVGSTTLAKQKGVSWSAATIRNTLAELEERGLLMAPHTSAGRVPTAKGYRLFVDSLLTMKPLVETEVSELRYQLGPTLKEQDLVEKTSKLLADITQLAGVVTLPRRESIVFRHIEFLSLSDKRILVIWVLNDHEVQNSIITTDRNYTSSELEQASNYLCEHYGGRELTQIKQELFNALQQDQAKMNELMEMALDLTAGIFDKSENEDYVLAGQDHLFDLGSVTTLEKLRELFTAFNKKNDILHLLEHCLRAESMQIFIGEESQHPVLRSCSVVTAPYKVNNEIIGVLGVIGPTRMNYQQVIPRVDVTAKLLSAALSPAD